MSAQIAENFIEALKKLESERDVETIAALFADNAEVGNVTAAENILNAKEFWTNYRDTFDTVDSEFKNKIIADGTAALEWTTSGTSKNGHEISYEGVSILETDGDKIKRFFAYFNPGKLGEQITENE